MVPVRVLGLAMDGGMQPVVLLTPLVAEGDVRRFVPVWIGAQEAASISIALRGEQAPRPLSHDLMQRLLQIVGATVDRIAITRLEEGTFFAELALATQDGRAVLDCRPSDAIALALRTGAPLFMAEPVLEEAGVEEDEPDDEDDPDRGEDAEQEVAEFRRFLDGVDPDDFQG